MCFSGAMWGLRTLVYAVGRSARSGCHVKARRWWTCAKCSCHRATIGGRMQRWLWSRYPLCAASRFAGVLALPPASWQRIAHNWRLSALLPSLPNTSLTSSLCPICVSCSDFDCEAQTLLSSWSICLRCRTCSFSPAFLLPTPALCLERTLLRWDISRPY